MADTNRGFVDVIAEMDQMGAALRSLAPVLAEYREALIEQGFNRKEALALLMSYQTDLLRPPGAA